MAHFRFLSRPRPLIVAGLIALSAAALPLSAGAQTGLSPAQDPFYDLSSRQPPPGEKQEGLTAELMYRLLVGDIALQRGEPALAARAYFEAARETQSAQLARRATEISIASRQRGLTLESARLWSELDPTAERPKQVIATVGAGVAGKSGEGMESDLKLQIEHALAETAASGPALAEAFLQLNRLLAGEADKNATYTLVVAVAKPYPNLPEAQFAVALAAFNTGLSDVGMMAAATAAVERALVLKPNWDRAALLKAEILGKQSPAAAIAYLETFLKAEPTSRPARGALAQLYVEQKRYADARAIFQKLWDEDKTAREFQFGIAVLSMQMKDWPAAEANFEDLKRAEYGENGAVELYLAQIAEETGRYDLAIERYKAVPEGEREWIANLRIAAIMAKQNHLPEARKYLADLPAVTIEQRIQVRQTEAQLLRDTGENAAAFEVLTKALAEFPDDPDLLYDTAMAAEKLDKLDLAEADLKRLIELRPDNAQALNALGYTLVDRTPRAAEGLDYIQKALKLEPGDPFILDSMGWAMYRLGKYDDAVDYLKRALADRPDAEIAAHLGEVLWAKGDRGAAQEVWQSALKTTPDNTLLQQTVKRLSP
jgi:tetratricopeptide (TPR) repeat protein